MKHNILVFPSGSEIGLEIHNSLKWSTHFQLIGLSSESCNHSKYVYSKYHENAPYISDSSIIDYLNQFILTHNIHYIFPAHDSVVLKLAENRDKLKCEVITSCFKTCSIARSKRTTYSCLRESVNVPETYSVQDKLKYPIFIKPNIGQGSRGALIVNSSQELSFHLREKNNQDLLLLEYLPGKEYTVDCFTDRFGELRFVGARERIRTSNGISVNSKVVHDAKINVFAKKLNDTLAFRGMWFFQLKQNCDNQLTLLEFAPRVGGTMSLYRNRGINFPLLALYDFMNIDISIIENDYPTEVDRALVSRYKYPNNYKHVYIDLDDTLIFENKINPFVMQFLYQCLNQNIQLHLLSRHKQDINITLRKFRLHHSLFDSVHIIDEEESKTDKIFHKNSIFIDDSFRERIMVYDKLSIPVFDTHQIESLIDWRF